MLNIWFTARTMSFLIWISGSVIAWSWYLCRITLLYKWKNVYLTLAHILLLNINLWKSFFESCYQSAIKGLLQKLDKINAWHKQGLHKLVIIITFSIFCRKPFKVHYKFISWSVFRSRILLADAFRVEICCYDYSLLILQSCIIRALISGFLFL